MGGNNNRVRNFRNPLFASTLTLTAQLSFFTICSVNNMTTAQLRKALSLREKLDELEAEFAGLFNSSPLLNATEATVPGTSEVGGTRPKFNKVRRTMSPAARARIAAGARKRWRLAKAAGKTTLGG
ncbi:MAG: hypothetical protein QOF48_3490 [Verrucomicrobiota bacterium]|jgi:hypothetical protein